MKSHIIRKKKRQKDQIFLKSEFQKSSPFCSLERSASLSFGLMSVWRMQSLQRIQIQRSFQANTSHGQDITNSVTNEELLRRLNDDIVITSGYFKI